jgi:hypothetical protein
MSPVRAEGRTPYQAVSWRTDGTDAAAECAARRRDGKEPGGTGAETRRCSNCGHADWAETCASCDALSHWVPDPDLPLECRACRHVDGPEDQPPCERWGRYWSGGPSARVRRQLGDDGGCFASALAAVRRWGGVLEHPEASHAWRAHGLIPPLKRGGWSVADDLGGWTCCVEQGHYGHRARKATWLYARGVELPSLTWGRNGRGEIEVVGWTKRTLREAFDGLRDRAGAAGLWLHDLRRSMSTVAQERGHAASAVQRVGGWEDPGVMQRHYSHAGRAAQAAVVDDLAGVLLDDEQEEISPDQPRVWN